MQNNFGPVGLLTTIANIFMNTQDLRNELKDCSCSEARPGPLGEGLGRVPDDVEPLPVMPQENAHD